MAVLRLTFIFLLHLLCVICVNCDKDVNENLNEFYRPQIWSLVNHLNSKPDRVYNYNYATLISAQNKDVDCTDLTIEVEVDCHRPSSGLCITSKVVCNGAVSYNTEQARYETLPGASCAPKVHVDLSRDDVRPSVAEEQHHEATTHRREEAEAPAEVDLTHEVTNDGNVSGEQFIAVRPNSGLCLGCAVDVNTNVEGLDLLTDTALEHIESERSNKQALVRVLRVQQQVVSGIKYIIVIEVASTTCPKNISSNTCVLDANAVPEICEITYFQQPWLSKRKQIISNNCTESQEYSTGEEQNASQPNGGTNDLDNEIDVNFGYKKPVAYPTERAETGDNVPNYDSIADTGHADDILKMSGGGIMDPSRMKEVESQVVYRKAEEPTPAMTTEETRVLTDEQREALDGLLGMMGDQPRVKRSPHHDNNNNNDDDSSSSSSSSSSSDEDDKQDHKQKKKNKKHHDDDNNKDNNNNNNNNDDSSSSSSSSSSSEEDNNVDDKKHKSKRNRRAALSDDNTSESESKSVSSEEMAPAQPTTRQKRQADTDEESLPSASSEETQEHKVKRSVSSASSSSSEEHGDTTTAATVAKQEDSSDSSSEEHKDNRAKRETKSSEDDSSESNEAIEDKEDETDVQQPHEQIEHAVPIKHDTESDELLDSEEVHGGVRRKRSVNSASQMVKVTPDEKNFVNNLADFSVLTLDDIDADNHKRVVLQILGAKKSSDDDGILYYLTLRVGISHCDEEKPRTLYRIDLMKQHKPDPCRGNLFENLTKICKVQVHVTNEKTSPNVVKSHCQNIKKNDDNDTDRNRTHRLRRAGGAGVPGGVSNVNPNDAKIQNYAKELLQQLDSQNGNTQSTQFVQVKSATKQVVAGVLYKLKIDIKVNGVQKTCDYEVWDRSWLPEGKEVKVQCEGDTEQKNYRYRRSEQHIIGGDDHDIHMGLFKYFTYKFNKTYDNKSEYKRRFRIFRSNMKIIQKLNEGEQGTATYGPTVFADMTPEEYKRHLGLKPELYNPNNIPYPQAVIPDIELPKEFDWRTKGAVSEVKNQGQCGSCWAFSVTGNIEGQHAIKSGKLLELSEQELVDCDKLDSGCNGGLPDNAYRAIEQLGGLETETDYPYDAEDEKCHFNKSLTKVQISGAVNISSNETDMAKWLVQNGPISIGINANAMQFYMGGVSHPFKFLCNPKNLDHGVLIVGYGVHKYPLFNKILPYWIVKNSWGPNWGEQGYYRVYRGDGTCGVNQMASSAVL